MSMLRILLLTLLAVLPIAAAAAPLSGTKSVGPTGDYLSITAAIADVQAVGNGLGGALVLELQGTYLGTVETFPLTIPALNGASAVNTLTIRPASGATALAISSADTTAATVELNGAQFVTIDGRPGGVGSNAGSGGGAASQLTIANTSASGVAVRFINEASGNTLRYTTLRGVNASFTSGTVLFSTTTGANGNDNNTIDHCDISDGASTPINCICSAGSTGTTAQNNSSNTVSNCNVFNFHFGGGNAAGVSLVSGSTDWTITGSSFYQTAVRTAVAAEVWAVYVNTGSNMVVTNNFIGGSAPSAGGTAWTTTGTSAAYRFTGIELRVGTTTPSSVQGNTIQNMVWTSNSNLTGAAGVWCGIYVFSGSANVGTVTGNTIGRGTGTGSVSVTTSGNSGTSVGIGSSSGGTVAIANNTIGSITMSGTTTAVSSSIIGIRVTAGAKTIAGNTVGSTTTANSLNAPTAAGDTGGVQQVTGILSSSTGSASITGNTVANFNNNTVSTVGTSQVRGISTSAGLNTITGNTIRNLSTTSKTSGNSALGIEQISTTAGQTVSQNIVHSLSNTDATNGVVVIGIYYAGSTTAGPNIISRNLVHSLSVVSSDSLARVIGMIFDTGTFTVQNNMVSVGLTASGASMPGTGGGITDQRTTPGRRFYHNSVYVGGTQTSGTSGMTAFTSLGTDNVRDFRGNIFFNARTGTGGTSGTAKHYAVRFSGAVTSTGLTCNNNIYLVTGVGGVLGYYNSVDRTTFAAWQAATGQDATSLNLNPLYLNPTGTAATVNLHIPANSPANNAGLPLASVTDDFDGAPRSLTTPAIGADEVPAPDIAITQTTALTDGAGSVSFGTVTLGSSSSSAKTFTITNPGTADLTGLAFTPKDGANPGDFTVSVLSGTSVPAAGGSVTFTVTFTPGASGARSAAIHIASNVTGTKNPFDIALTGTGQTAFEAWAASNTVANDPNALGANGQKNLFNFAFGINPVTGGNGELLYAGTLAGGGTITSTGLPRTWLEPSGNGVDFRALFVRRKDYVAAGLTYTPQFSADLATWVNSAAVPAVLADDGANQIVSVPYPVFVAGKKARFFRISVSLAP